MLTGKEFASEMMLRYRPSRLAASVPVPVTEGTGPSVLAFSLPKAGSSLLYNLLRGLSSHVRLTYVGLDEYLWEQNLVYRPTDIGPVFLEQGYCYGGFRAFPFYPIPILETARTVLLVRDPRDILVSLYFSVRESHKTPAGSGPVAKNMAAARNSALQTPVDAWIREHYAGVVACLEGYLVQGFTRRGNVAIYRYEDVIFNKDKWAMELASWYGWTIRADAIRSIVAPLDILPSQERPGEHIRQVHPGNYRAHLTEQTQQKLKSLFRRYMQEFGYR